jgi:hypothetical protein
MGTMMAGIRTQLQSNAIQEMPDHPALGTTGTKDSQQ